MDEVTGGSCVCLNKKDQSAQVLGAEPPVQSSWSRARVNRPDGALSLGPCLGRERKKMLGFPEPGLICLRGGLTAKAGQRARDPGPSPPGQQGIEVAEAFRGRGRQSGAVVCMRVRAGVSSLGEEEACPFRKAGYKSLSWDFSSPPRSPWCLGALVPSCQCQEPPSISALHRPVGSLLSGAGKMKLEAGLGLVWGQLSFTDGCHRCTR